MILQEKKKAIELGVYEKQIYESLQEAYKNRFSKYIDEQNYEIFTFEKKEDENQKTGEESVQNTTSEHYVNTLVGETRSTYRDIITQNINIAESFKKFVGKEIHLKKEEHYYDCESTQKEDTKVIFSSSRQQKNKHVVSRIDVIKNTVCEIQNSLKSKIDLTNQKNNYLTILVEKLKQIEDTLYAIVKYGETEDGDFLNNLKYYKFIHNFIIHKEQNVFDIIQQMKSNRDENHLSSRTQILSISNALSFQKQFFHGQFQNVVDKVDYFFPLLHNSCFQEKEALVNVLLSFCFFFSIGLNENIHKRIINYISLAYLKLKKWKEYLLNEKYRKPDNAIFNLKATINKKYDKEHLKNVLHIDIREYDKHVLTIYKKILKNELHTQMISVEVNKITETIKHLNQNLDIDTRKLKFIFSKLPT